MISVDVRFGNNKAPEVAFMQRGQVILHDTCMIVSGPILRFRLPLVGGLFQSQLAAPGYRSIPYGAVQRSSAQFTAAFRRLHKIDYRLPSGKVIRLSFTVLGGSERARAFRAALDENLTATKALFDR